MKIDKKALSIIYKKVLDSRTAEERTIINRYFADVAYTVVVSVTATNTIIDALNKPEGHKDE